MTNPYLLPDDVAAFKRADKVEITYYPLFADGTRGHIQTCYVRWMPDEPPAFTARAALDAYGDPYELVTWKPIRGVRE